MKINSTLDINTVLIPKIQNLLNNNSEEYLSLKIVGTSMFPFLKNGDKILIKSIRFNDLKTGDLVTFQRNEKLFTHRILQIMDNKIITKGDNLLLPDEAIYQNQIIGKVIQVEKKQKIINLNDNYWRRINLYLGLMQQIFYNKFLYYNKNLLRINLFKKIYIKSLHFLVLIIESIFVYGK